LPTPVVFATSEFRTLGFQIFLKYDPKKFLTNKVSSENFHFFHDFEKSYFGLKTFALDFSHVIFTICQICLFKSLMTKIFIIGNLEVDLNGYPFELLSNQD